MRSASKQLQKATLLYASTLTVMAGAAVAPALPQIHQEFQAVADIDLLSKLVLTIPALLIAIGSRPVGWFIDRFGRIRLLQFAILFYSIAGFTPYFLTDIYGILLSRGFLGLAVAGIMTTSTTLVGDYYEGEERDRFMGTQGAFMALGGMVFVSLSGVLADVSWRHPFIIYLLALPALILTTLYLKEPQKQQKAEEQQAEKKPINKTVYLVYATAFFLMITFYMVPVQLPFYLKSLGIAQNSLAGLAIAVVTFMSAMASFNYGKVRAKLNHQHIFFVIFLMMAIGYFWLSLSSTYIMVLIAMAIAGVGGGFMMANCSLWVISFSTDHNRGKIVGGLTTFIFIGQFFSPILVEPIAEPFGLANAYAIAAAAMLVVGVAYLIDGIRVRRLKRQAT